MSNVLKASLSGFGNAKVASLYHAYRPSYPREVIRASLTPIITNFNEMPTAVNLKNHKASFIKDSTSNFPPKNTIPNLRILELGSGTGLSTQEFIQCLDDEAGESLEYELHCVDPSQAMSEELIKSMKEKFPSNCDHISVNVGSATSIPFPDNYFHGCVAAQSFHWFATKENIDAISSKLGDYGVFSVIWNTFDIKDTWHGDMFQKLLGPLFKSGNAPIAASEEAITALKSNANFQTVSELHLPGYSYWLTEHQIHNRLCTISVVENLSLENREIFLQTVSQLLRGYDAKYDTKQAYLTAIRDVSAENGTTERQYLWSYECVVLTAMKQTI